MAPRSAAWPGDAMPTGKRMAVVGGLSMGLLIAGAVVVSGLVPRGTGTLGADVTFIVGPTGELAIPSGALLREPALRPGEAASGSVAVRNQTGRTLAVAVRVLPSIPDLDGVLRVRVGAGSRELYDGTLGGLRSWSTPFRIRSGQLVPLRVQAWLRLGTDASSRGRIDDVPLAFRSTPVGAAS